MVGKLDALIKSIRKSGEYQLDISYDKRYDMHVFRLTQGKFGVDGTLNLACLEAALNTLTTHRMIV